MVGDIFQPTHLLFVLVVALLVLGPKRLPEVAKTLGKGIRDFRGAISGDSDHSNPVSSYLSGDNTPNDDEAPTATPTGQTPAPVSETPAPPPAAPAPTAATTPPGADPQPVQSVQPVDESVQSITTPGTIAAAPPASPAEPAPASPAPAEDAATQAHPAASSAERHE